MECKKLITTISILLFMYVNLSGNRLPLKNPKLTSTFGESRKDHFHNGIDFGGEQNIYPFMDGKIIFYYDKKEFPFDNYMGPGNMVVIQHQNRYRSYYYHLKEGSVNKNEYNVKETNIIGETGDTGHSMGIHLHLTIENLQPLEVLNPLKFFKDFISDNETPVIEGLYFKIGDKEPISIKSRIQIEEGEKITLILRCFDIYQNIKNRMGVYRIETYLNNNPFVKLQFDKLQYKNGTYFLPPNLTFNEVYYSKYDYIIGEFKPEEGTNKIEIIVSDYFGNSAKLKKSFNVIKTSP